MKGQRAKEALKNINRLLASRDIPSDFIKSARIDHTIDMEKFHVSVVFSERCIRKLFELEQKTKRDQSEAGTFFYGRVKGNTLYIETYMSDFEKSDGLYKNCSVDITEKNMKELDMMTEYSSFNNHPYNIVVHVHTHPPVVINEHGVPITPNTFKYSEQDLYSYGYMQKYCQPITNNVVLFLGCLFAIDKERTQISIVHYDKVRKDFYNVSNIYFIHEGELYKFNNYNVENSRKIDDTTGIKLMKELKENN